MKNHNPESWSFDEDCIKGARSDGYPILFEVVHAEPLQVRIALHAPQLLAALKRLLASPAVCLETDEQEDIAAYETARIAIANAEGR